MDILQMFTDLSTQHTRTRYDGAMINRGQKGLGTREHGVTVNCIAALIAACHIRLDAPKIAHFIFRIV